MKKLFYIGLAGLALFEILKVYFIMPMPGSQEMDSIDIAYFLHKYRWSFRVVFGLMIIAGSRSEEHTSELQSQSNLVCRLLLEKKKAILNGVLAPPLVVLVVLLTGDRKVMGKRVNSRRAQALGWVCAWVMSHAAWALLIVYLVHLSVYVFLDMFPHY